MKYPCHIKAKNTPKYKFEILRSLKMQLKLNANGITIETQ